MGGAIMQNAGRILLMPKGDYSASATYEMLDLVNHSGASWVCKKACTGQTPSDSNTEFWQRFGTAVDMSKYLPITGGYLTGNLYFKKVENGQGVVYKDHNASNDYGMVLRDDDANGNSVRILLSALSNAIRFRDTTSTYRDILHTGNKPTGTYTGNGDSTTRYIETGGIGNTLLVRCDTYTSILTAGISFSIKNDGTIQAFNGMSCWYQNGTASINTDNAALNASGVVYTYDVL
jgi:hypothetical protein